MSRYSAVRRQGEPVKGVEPRVLDYTSQQAKVVVVIIVVIVVVAVVLPPLGQATGLHFRQIHLQIQIQSWMFSTMIERLNPGLQLAANPDEDKVKHKDKVKYKDKVKHKDKKRTKSKISESFEARFPGSAPSCPRNSSPLGCQLSLGNV